MRSSPTCPRWRPDDCVGTPHCPPRCPRYVADDGTTYTIYSPGDWLDVDDPSGPNDDPDGSDTEWLVAVRTVDVVGAATFFASRASATIDLTDGADSALGLELARQVIARAVDTELPSLTLHGPSASLSRLAAEFGDAAVVRDDRTVEVDLESAEAARTRLFPSGRADVRVPTALSALVDPDAVAVVGATNREGSIGRVVVENLLETFEGEVIPVTDRHEEVLGLSAVPSVEALETPVDLAVIVLPADAALEAVRAAGERGVDAVAVLSAGFSESDDEGAGRERELRALVERDDLTLVGPNALGVLSTRSGLNASFAPALPETGSVSVMSHSGATITAILEWATAEGVGLRDVVSIGNGAGVDEATLLRHWGADEGTDVVLAYLEDVADGRAFVEAARAVSDATPVVALKAGRTEAGLQAAASHTGALVSDDVGFDAAFEAANVIRARSLQDAFDLVRGLERGPLPLGDRVAVVTNAGGPGVLAADAVADADCTLAGFAPETRAGLEETLPDAASAENPVDVLGDADVDRFVRALEVVLADPGVDAVLTLSTPHPLVSPSALASAIGDAGRRYGKPVLTCFAGGPPSPELREAFAEAGVPNYPDAERAARTLASLATYAAARRRPATDPDPVRIDDAVHRRLEAVREEGRLTLGVDSTSILEAAGIPTPRSALVHSRAEAAEVAPRLGDEVVLKVASPDLAHKTDVGGVTVGVPADEAGTAYARLLERVESNAPEAHLRGVLVQELAPDGLECLAGVTHHPRFGPVVTFGLGGVFVEHLEDVAHALAPLSQDDARRLVRSIDAASMLDGPRGDDPVDVDALADALVRLSRLATEHPIRELEINPLVATPDGVLALDVHGRLEDGP